MHDAARFIDPTGPVEPPHLLVVELRHVLARIRLQLRIRDTCGSGMLQGPVDRSTRDRATEPVAPGASTERPDSGTPTQMKRSPTSVGSCRAGLRTLLRHEAPTISGIPGNSGARNANAAAIPISPSIAGYRPDTEIPPGSRHHEPPATDDLAQDQQRGNAGDSARRALQSRPHQGEERQHEMHTATRRP